MSGNKNRIPSRERQKDKAATLRNKPECLRKAWGRRNPPGHVGCTASDAGSPFWLRQATALGWRWAGRADIEHGVTASLRHRLRFSAGLGQGMPRPAPPPSWKTDDHPNSSICTEARSHKQGPLGTRDTINCHSLGQSCLTLIHVPGDRS